jgi:hypothetical protein
VESEAQQEEIGDPNERELEEINGVKCSKIVKYLGVKVSIDRKE